MCDKGIQRFYDDLDPETKSIIKTYIKAKYGKDFFKTRLTGTIKEEE